MSRQGSPVSRYLAFELYRPSFEGVPRGWQNGLGWVHRDGTAWLYVGPWALAIEWWTDRECPQLGLVS